METALDVLSRAATMVDNANEARLTSKELPTTKWRRDRRLRATEYHSTSSTATTGNASPPSSPLIATAGASAITAPPLHLTHHNMESPIDMSVTSTTLKHRASPPPPYREPLPGSTYASSLARPSVITQAPSKRDSILISNREHDNRSTESVSMCETVIDEHFRRSLGADYVALFGKKSPAPTSTSSPSPQSPQQLPMGGPIGTVASHYASPGDTPPAAAYHATLTHPQALITPKPTAILLSPAAAVKMEAISPRLDKTQAIAPIMSLPLPPPQQQPLALQRASSPQRNSAARNSASPLPLQTQTQPLSMTVSGSSGTPLTQQRNVNAVAYAMATAETSITIPSPHHSPPAVVAKAESAPSAAEHAVSPIVSSTAVAASRTHIKAEPDSAVCAPVAHNTATPPPSPSSSISNASVSTNCDILASVDDHFAKALGDTWKKLQENKELRK